MSDPAWDLFQSLHAVMQAGSFSAAARARGLTQPTLGRHIEALETALGAPLFVRSPRGLTPHRPRPDPQAPPGGNGRGRRLRGP